MALEVYYRQDIVNALRAAEFAALAALRAAPEDQRGAAFQAGYRSALLTLALSFGVSEEFTSNVSSLAASSKKRR